MGFVFFSIVNDLEEGKKKSKRYAKVIEFYVQKVQKELLGGGGGVGGGAANYSIPGLM